MVVNTLGVYGVPAMLMIHGGLRVKYPTEVEAAAHILNPFAPRFIPAPVGPLQLWCPGCKGLKLADAFSPCADRKSGRRGYCKACERSFRKQRRAKKHHQDNQERWYRG